MYRRAEGHGVTYGAGIAAGLLGSFALMQALGIAFTTGELTPEQRSQRMKTIALAAGVGTALAGYLYSNSDDASDAGQTFARGAMIGGVAEVPIALAGIGIGEAVGKGLGEGLGAGAQNQPANQSANQPARQPTDERVKQRSNQSASEPTGPTQETNPFGTFTPRTDPLQRGRPTPAPFEEHRVCTKRCNVYVNHVDPNDITGARDLFGFAAGTRFVVKRYVTTPAGRRWAHIEAPGRDPRIGFIVESDLANQTRVV